MDNIKGDPRQTGLTWEDAQDRAKWKRLTKHLDPTYKCEKMKRKKNVFHEGSIERRFGGQSVVREISDHFENSAKKSHAP